MRLSLEPFSRPVVMIAPTPVLPLHPSSTCFNGRSSTLQRSSHTSTVGPPPASTFLTYCNGRSSTCFNVPHMPQRSVFHLLQRSAHASTVLTYNHGSSQSSHLNAASTPHMPASRIYTTGARTVIARDVCLLLYKFHTRISCLLSFQFCSPVYVQACLIDRPY